MCFNSKKVSVVASFRANWEDRFPARTFIVLTQHSLTHYASYINRIKHFTCGILSALSLSLGRSDCIFRDDGRGLPLGGAGRPDRPPPVAAHLSLHQQCLLLLLLLRPGIQHLSALPTPFRCRVGLFYLTLASLKKT